MGCFRGTGRRLTCPLYVLQNCHRIPEVKSGNSELTASLCSPGLWRGNTENEGGQGGTFPTLWTLGWALFHSSRDCKPVWLLILFFIVFFSHYRFKKDPSYLLPSLPPCVLIFLKKNHPDPSWCGSVDWESACKLKGCWFDSRSGHMPGLWAGSPLGGM